MKRKLIMAILGVIFGFGILVFSVTFLQLIHQRDTVQEKGKEEAQELSGEALNTLSRLNGQEAKGYARSCTKYFNKTFANMRKNVQAVQGEIGSLYDAPAGGTVHGGTAELVKGVSWDEVAGEFRMLAPVCNFIRHLPGYNPEKLEQMDIYVMTESGMCLDGAGRKGGNHYSDLRRTEWYREAKKTGEIYWTGIFRGKISGEEEIVCAMPYFDNRERFCGCVAAGMKMEAFQEIVDDFDEKQLLSVIFFDRSNRLMYASSQYGKTEEARKHLRTAEDVATGEEEIYAFRTLKETGWTICLVLDQKEVRETMRGLREDIMANVGGIVDILQESIRRTILFFAVSLGAGCLLAVIAANILAGGFVKPIRLLTVQAGEVGSGNLEQQIQVQSRDEIGQLAESFQRMQEELRDYMANLQSVTAERERMEAEADVARQIQMNMLPREAPACPDGGAFDIYAQAVPSAHDGGSFYDFFMADKEHLCVTLGEVSGGGIPATVFAVITRTHIQNYAKLGYQADRILMEANNQLSAENEVGLTVSVFLGIVDLRTGMLQYVNAGQMTPLFKMSGRGFEALEAKSCFALGNMENVPYWQQSVGLSQGDMIFIYTQGVSGTTDEKGNIYTEEYLQESLAGAVRHHFSLYDIAEAVRADLAGFSGNISQKKDSTFLLLRYFGGTPGKRNKSLR